MAEIIICKTLHYYNVRTPEIINYVLHVCNLNVDNYIRRHNIDVINTNNENNRVGTGHIYHVFIN